MLPSTSVIAVVVGGLAGGADAFGYIEKACTLAVPESAGAPLWVQTGNVFKLWTTDSHPRDIISTSSEIAHGSYYAILCTENGYTADSGCVATCNDGALDLTTYCSGTPEMNCVPQLETQMATGCDLDWTSDEEMFDTGMSFKEHWQKVVDLWTGDGLAAMLNFGGLGQGPFWTSSPPTTASSGFMLLPHSFANLIYMGLGIELFVNQWNHDLDGTPNPAAKNYLPFTWESVNLATYQSFADDFEYVADPLGSTADGTRFFDDWGTVDALQTDGIVASFNNSLKAPIAAFPSAMDMRPTYLATVAMPYNPCDKDGDPVFLGLPKACFHIHQAGVHTQNGQMVPFYKPLKDGTLDFHGVCSYEEVYASEYQAMFEEAMVTPSTMDITSQVLEAQGAAGGYLLSHGRTWGVHFCVDWALTATDSYAKGALHNPVPCTLNPWSADWKHGELGEFMILDPVGFVHDPVQKEDELCERHLAGECSLSFVAGDYDITPELFGEYN